MLSTDIRYKFAGSLAFLLFFLLLSCAHQPKSVQPEASLAVQQDALGALIERAVALMDSGRYAPAADLLRSAGQQDYSYYRMDEVLYWLGRCNLGLGDSLKADRCFTLLRQYYPRAESRLAGFKELQAWSAQSLAVQFARQQPANPSSAETYGGPPVSNSFYETDVRQALMDLATQAGISIIPDAMVQGFVSLELKEAPLEQALSLILGPLGFSYRKVENCYMVGSPAPDSPSFPLLTETQVVTPLHLRAEDVPKLLPDYYKTFLKVNPEANTLTVSAPPEIIRRFRQELKNVDHAPQQILIEALVVEMGDAARRSLGLEWDWTGTKGMDTFQITKLLPVATDTAYLLMQMERLGDHVAGMTFDLRLALQALALKDQATIRANPRIATVDGKEATVRVGKEAYYSLLQGTTLYSYVTLEKISTGITLKITPCVGKDGEITTDIAIEVSDVTGSGATNLPVTSVRTVNTRVQIANGETIGIGGLLSENKREQRHRVPFLGDIPILGYLFGNTTTTKETTEVVVLITPHLLINPNEFDQL